MSDDDCACGKPAKDPVHWLGGGAAPSGRHTPIKLSPLNTYRCTECGLFVLKRCELANYGTCGDGCGGLLRLVEP